MCTLIGEYECTLDSKNRLMVPASFRNVLKSEEDSNRWAVFLHKDKRLWLMPEPEFQRQTAKFRPTLLPREEQLGFARKLFGNTRLVETDKQGRVVIQDKLARKASLSHELTLVGMGRYIEIWNREDWEREDEKDDYEDRYREALNAGIEVDLG